MCLGGSLLNYSSFIHSALFFALLLVESCSCHKTMTTANFTRTMENCLIRMEFLLDEDGIFRSLPELQHSLLGELPESLDVVIHSVSAPSQSFQLDLTRNRALLQSQDQGNGASSDLHKSRLCYYYHGMVEDDTSSHAAVNLCGQEINGVILVNGAWYVLESDAESESSDGISLIPSSHYVDDTWSGDGEEPQTLDPLTQNCDFPGSSHEFGRRGKRRARKKQVRPSPSYYRKFVDGEVRYVELVLVNDNSLYRKFNFDKSLVEDRARQIANIVNSLYFPLNIRVSLVGIETWTRGDKVTITDDGDYTLQNFLLYRKKRLNLDIPNDNAQLLTDRVFKSGVVGKALKGTMCSFERSGGVNLDHSRRIVSVASTVAHEMGHNFGMEHDNDTCQCPKNQRCIMSASSGGLAPTYWSSCSLEYLEWGLLHGSDFCLKNMPDARRIVDGPVCGNGILEAGEQCDCGVPGTCDNDCCNATNCQLAEGAECATGGCCDRTKCKVKSATKICRSAEDECDLAEHCDGVSEICPDNVHKQDGITCYGGQGYCEGGRCGVRDSQCEVLWGRTGHSSPDLCYTTLNTHKNVHGNCGFDRATDTYTPCTDEDTMCGRLHCVHQNERTELGDRSVVQTAHTFLQRGGGEYAVCRVAQLDLGGIKDHDPGMVPNGAKCGANRMCWKAKCSSVDKILSERPCDPPDCKGVGVCNSRGNCHCHFGYGGRDCGMSGLGGSIDSGPSGPAGSFNVWVGVGVFVFVIFPLLVAALTFLYRKKPHWLLKYKLLRYLLPRSEAKTPSPRMDGSVSSNNSSPSHRLVFAAKPPPINAIPVTQAQELNRMRQTQGSLTSMDIGFPPLPPSAASKPTHLLNGMPGSSLTLPRSKNAQGTQISPTMTSSVIDYSSGVSTLSRTPSQRPQKPAPPRPKRPRESLLDQIYAETGGDLKNSEESSGLLTEVMTALNGSEKPHRRAPQPPLDPEQPPEPIRVGLRPPKHATPPPEDPGNGQEEEQWASIDDSMVNSQSLSISGPSNPVIGGKIVTKSPELTVVSTAPGGTQTLPPKRIQRTISSAGESSDGSELGGRRVQRSVSSASSSSGRSVRPRKAPPPPPKPAPLVESDIPDEENYYDVIPTPPEEEPRKTKKTTLPLSYGEDVVKKPTPPSIMKPPLPSKPKNPSELLKSGSEAGRGSDSRVSALKAKFDQKSGDVRTSLVK